MDIIGCRAFYNFALHTHDSSSPSLTFQFAATLWCLINFELPGWFNVHPHKLSPCSRLHPFMLRAHATIYQITRLYASSIYPLQVKFTRDRLIGRHSFGLTNLSHILIWKHYLNLNSLMVCKIFPLSQVNLAIVLSSCRPSTSRFAWSQRGPCLIITSIGAITLHQSSQQFSSFYLEWNFMTTDIHSRTFTLLTSVSRLN